MLSAVRLERSPLLPPPPLCVHCRASGETTSLRVLFLTVIAPTRGLFSSAFSVFTAHSCDSWRCRRLEKTLLSYSLPFSKHVPRSVPFWLICLVYPTLSIFLFLSFPLKQLLTWPVLLEGSLSRPSTFSLLFFLLYLFTYHVFIVKFDFKSRSNIFCCFKYQVC